MTKVTVIGAGNMGTNLVHLFLRNEMDVLVIEPNQETVNKLQKEIKKGKKNSNYNLQIRKDLPDEILTDFIVETVPEDLKIKQQIMENLEKILSDNTIICTNTSGLKISDISKFMKVPERVIGTHFFNPTTVIPLVEVIKGDKTSDDTSKRAMAFLNQVGKKPVLLEKEVSGFIANRIQHAISREAFHLAESGVATVEDIDEIIKWSIGIRLACTGPFEQRDLNGLDTHFNIASYLYEDLSNVKTPPNILKNKVEEGKLGLKSSEGFYDWRETNTERYKEENNKKLEKIIKGLES